jgi:hypothetical protein
MKNVIILVLFTFTITCFGQEVEETKEPKKAPVDFLDIFDQNRREKEFVRTTTDLVVSFGFNQALSNDNGIGDAYRFWGSGVFEVGLEFTTRLNPENDKFRFNYGLALRANDLSINNDKAFVTNNNVTNLAPLNFDIKRSDFIQYSIVAPFHLEFGPRKLKTYKDGIKRYKDDRAFVAGLGGYIGVVTSTSQSIRFDREGRTVTQTTANDYEINNFIYGVSAYAGWDNLQFFATYGLNDILKDSPIQERYLTFGIRLR